MASNVPAVSRLAPRSIHGALSGFAPATVAVVSPTIVATVTAAKTIRELMKAVTPTAPAARKTGRIVRSGSGERLHSGPPPLHIFA